jgi:class 3 adenylate cyclase
MTGIGEPPGPSDGAAGELARNPGVIATTLLSGLIAVAVAAPEWVGSGEALTSPAGILWAVVAALGVAAMLLGFGLELRRRRLAEAARPQAPPAPAAATSPPAAALPTGTVTFLFTDIEGSTRLLQELGDRYPAVRDEHAVILRRAIGDAGVEVSAEGDSPGGGPGPASTSATGWSGWPWSTPGPAARPTRGRPCARRWSCSARPTAPWASPRCSRP